MRVIYNGIDLGVIETYNLDVESVYDDSGTDYLYTKVSVLVRAMINGQVEMVRQLLPNDGVGVPPPGPFMSYAWNGHQTTQNQGTGKELRPTPLPTDPDMAGGFPNIPATSGSEFASRSPLRDIVIIPNAAPLTHEVIRHRLSIPRAKLFVFSGPGMESGSPKPGTDKRPAANGAAFIDGGPVTPDLSVINRDMILLESPVLDDADAKVITLPIFGYVLPIPPTKSLRTDCKNGPFPKLLGVHTVLGDGNTFMVDWGCETYINEGPINDTDYTGALLSNRFSQTHAVDENGFTSMITVGSAIFRTDFLNRDSTQINPDFFRPFLFMAIPQGFTRKINYVTGRADVTGVDYSYVDTQVPVNFTAGPYAQASQISVVHRQAVVSETDFLGTVMGAYERVLGIKANKSIARDSAAAANLAAKAAEEERGKYYRKKRAFIGKRKASPPSGP